MNLKIKKESIIFTLGFIFGLISIFFFGDRTLDNEWVVIVQNLENNKILSSRNINNEWVPNLFMPPLYPYFLYSIKKIFVFAEDYYVIVVLLIQLILFLILIYIFKKILSEIFFNKKVVIVGIFI